ncbi:uncharacterized [Tachysurus ichikawai]
MNRMDRSRPSPRERFSLGVLVAVVTRLSGRLTLEDTERRCHGSTLTKRIMGLTAGSRESRVRGSESTGCLSYLKQEVIDSVRAAYQH